MILRLDSWSGLSLATNACRTSGQAQETDGPGSRDGSSGDSSVGIRLVGVAIDREEGSVPGDGDPTIVHVNAVEARICKSEADVSRLDVAVEDEIPFPGVLATLRGLAGRTDALFSKAETKIPLDQITGLESSELSTR